MNGEEEIYAGLEAMLGMADQEGVSPLYWFTREDGLLEVTANDKDIYIVRVEKK